MDKQLMSRVAEDLAVVASSTNPNAIDKEIGRASVELRRLLIDRGSGLLSKAWSEVHPRGPSLKLQAKHLVTAACKGNGIAVASEAKIGTTTMHALSIAREPNAFFGNPFAEGSFKLSVYMTKPVIYHNGLFVNRKDVISLAANKLGGVHLDAKMTETEQALWDMAKDTVVISENPIIFVLRSIGQTLTASNDMIGLLEECRKHTAEGSFFESTRVKELNDIIAARHGHARMGDAIE